MARPATQPSASSYGSTTRTLEEPSSSSPHMQSPETLVLRLRRPKKKVTWKEGTVDNELLGRKSSKKCCIFHKQKPFDEDDSDDEEAHGSHAGCGRSEGNGDGCPSHSQGSHSN